ncbi:MAG: cytochrome c [Planctomycetia bacterium]|nr:cytochrome c [Planctomycetia bacterium]
MRVTTSIPKTSILTAIGLAIGLALAGCDKGSSTSNTSPSGPPAMGPPPGTIPGGQPGMQPGQPPVDETGPYAAGKKVFTANNCGRCHRITGMPMAGGPGGPPPGGPGPGGPGAGGPGPGGPPSGGPGGPPGGPPGRGGFGTPAGRAPDLSKVGADPEHTVEWLIAFIRNPRATKPDGRMPPFEGKISDDDLKSLAEFLASLKE